MENMEPICSRKVDELGRIVLPREVRSKLGWGTGDSVSLYYVDGDKLVLQLHERYPRQKFMFLGDVGSILAILLLVKKESSKISVIIGLLVGGQLMSTSSTMFANPQVTVARMFTDTVSGIRPIDGIIFITMQIIGALLAYAVYRLLFTNKIYGTEEK